MPKDTQVNELERCRPWIEAALEYSGGTHEFEDVAIIANWVEKGTPSIRIPHYISNDILEQICKMVQTMEAPK